MHVSSVARAATACCIYSSAAIALPRRKRDFEDEEYRFENEELESS